MARFLIIAALHALIGNSLASTDCFRQHSLGLAELSKCGTSDKINSCLSQLDTYDQTEISSCFEDAGCSIHEAKYETQQIIERCLSLYEVHEIRKRATSTDSKDDATTTADDSEESSTAEPTSEKSSSVESTSTQESTTEASSSTEATSTSTSSSSSSSTIDATTTNSASAASATTASTDASTVQSTTTSSGTSSPMSGTACFTTHTKQTEICNLVTTGGVTETATCTQGESLSSECAADRVCTTNSSGDDICMERQGIQTGGIVIASVFGAAAIAFFGGLFFACFRGSQREKQAAYTPLKN